MKLTVLGCGSSMGTPAAGGFWGRCDPAHPRNTRMRAGVLVQEGNTTVLVDAGPDLRFQLNAAEVKEIDAVLLTHAHDDHIAGIDDLRGYAYRRHLPLDCYAMGETLDELSARFSHVFRDNTGFYTPFLNPRPVGVFDDFLIGDLQVRSFAQDHGSCASLGFRFGDVAYSADVLDLPFESLTALRGIDTWIVDAGGYWREDVTTHANLQRVLKWVDILKPRMTYLTVLTTHMDYQTLCDELPAHVRPAWDGLEIVPGSNGPVG